MRDVWQAGELDGVPGIGKEIAKKIDELMRTGKLDYFERLRAKVPDGVAALLNVQDLGPKRVKLIWETLGVTNLDALEAAAQPANCAICPRWGPRPEQRILAGIVALRARPVGRPPG